LAFLRDIMASERNSVVVKSDIRAICYVVLNKRSLVLEQCNEFDECLQSLDSPVSTHHSAFNILSPIKGSTSRDLFSRCAVSYGMKVQYTMTTTQCMPSAFINLCITSGRTKRWRVIKTALPSCNARCNQRVSLASRILPAQL